MKIKGAKKKLESIQHRISNFDIQEELTLLKNVTHQYMIRLQLELMIMFNKMNNIEYLTDLLFNPEKTWIMAIFISVLEFMFNIYMVKNGVYGDIDWPAYMSQVRGFANGSLNYYDYVGVTGPCVYPAGYMYLYTAIYIVTERGCNIEKARHITALAGFIMTISAFRIYSKSKKIPPYLIAVIFVTCYRTRILHTCRLFNDPFVIMFLLIAVNFYISEQWLIGSIIFSAALSIKMNILLFVPPLLVILYHAVGIEYTFLNLIAIGCVQIILGLPFLFSNPVAYITRAFDFSRSFDQSQSMFWQYVPEHIFQAKLFHLILLILHISMLGAFNYTYWNRCLKHYNIFRKNSAFVAQVVSLSLFVSNFVGIMVARSLHGQFFSWYYHTLPIIIWSTTFSTRDKLVVFLAIEFCWSQIPPVAWAGVLFHVCHISIVYNLLKNRPAELSAAEFQRKMEHIE